MEERELEDLVGLVPPLLQALDRLAFVSRHFDPGQFGELMAAVGEPDAALRELRPRLDAWPEPLAHIRGALADATDEALAAFTALRAAPEEPDGLTAVFRALRHLPRAEEALYPLARGLPPVSRFFLDPEAREDATRLTQLAQAPLTAATGVLHSSDEPGARGGFSMYLPEDYDPARPLPLVVALHGGSGNGRAFLWSWVRAARTAGAIVVAPTAIGRTWALQGTDVDSPNLSSIVEFVASRWSIDPERRLLTGMSDGGTFSYVSGLDAGSPFTHLAPVSAAFHPMLAQFADPERLTGLPIHIVHGARDWMFPATMAREAEAALGRAGATVTYVEMADLSHTYPREMSREILAWLNGA